MKLDFNAKDRYYMQNYAQTGQIADEAQGYEHTITPFTGSGNYYKLLGIRRLTASENNGNRHAFVVVLDPTGNIDRARQIDWGWQGMQPNQKPRPIVQDKPPHERPNVPLNPGQRCWFQVLGMPSERVENIHTMYPTDGGNHSWYLVFCPVRGSGPKPPEPPQPPQPKPEPPLPPKPEPPLPPRPDNSQVLALLNEAQALVNQANQKIEQAKNLLK